MFIFAFVSLKWRDIWKKYIKADIKEYTAYVFSFQSYSSKYCIKIFIHFKFVFVYAIKKQFSMILLPVAVQFSQHHLLRVLYFPIVCSCLFWQRLIDHISLGIFLVSLFGSIDLWVCSCSSIILLWLLYFYRAVIL